jgi:predicted Zn finger-like uncharacterized protein
MLIVCPSCTTSYTVRPNSLRPYGQARCLRCLAIWSPQRHRADMLVAAAAAIGRDFAPLPEAKQGEADTSPLGEGGNVEAPGFHSDPLIFEESDALTLDPAFSSAGEGVYGSPGFENESANHEIYFVDLDPDNLPLVPEDAAVDQAEEHPTVERGQAGAALDHGEETSVVPEPVALDSPSDDAPAVSDQLASPVENVPPIPIALPDEQSHASATEATGLNDTVPASANNTCASDHLASKGTEVETWGSHTVDTNKEAPLEEGSDLEEAPEHAAALIREPRPDARRWIVLKANNAGLTPLEKATDLTLRNALRPRHNLPVLSRGAQPPAPRRFVPRWPITRLQAGIVALALVDFLLVGWRTDIVRKLPQTASFYELAGLPVNLRGLAFHGITTTTVRDGGKPVLVVEGDIVNNTAKALRVPQLRIAVRDAADQEIYFWTATATRSSLPPGQAMTFRARLASPPPGARDVVLRFVNRRDAVVMNP